MSIFLLLVRILIVTGPLFLFGEGEISIGKRFPRTHVSHVFELPDSMQFNPSEIMEIPIAESNDSKGNVGGSKTDPDGPPKKDVQSIKLKMERNLSKYVSPQLRVATKVSVPNEPKRRTDDFAILGFLIFLMLGIPMLFVFLPLGIFFSVLAFTFSTISLFRISKQPDKLKGKGLALFSFIFSIIVIGVWLSFAILSDLVYWLLSA
jgi:hypothetical protein